MSGDTSGIEVSNCSYSDSESGSHCSDSDNDVPSALSGRHPLWCRWVLWYDGTSKKSNIKNWSDNLKEISKFDTVEDFWSLYSTVHPPSKLNRGSSYHLFKHGVKPMWEHEANKRGGKWTVSIPKKYKDKLDLAWRELSVSMVAEHFDEGDDVLGAVVSVRRQADRISIWTRFAKDEALCTNIGVQFREVLERVGLPEISLFYQAHADSLEKDSSYSSAPLYKIDTPIKMKNSTDLPKTPETPDQSFNINDEVGGETPIAPPYRQEDGEDHIHIRRDGA